MLVDLAGDVALETAQDVQLGQALFGPPINIGPGRCVAVHTDQGDAPQGVVGAAVAAPVEPVAVGAARGGGDGGGAAQVPEMLQSPERDVLLVTALVSIIVVLAFTDWGILAYIVTGLIFAVLFFASSIANRRRRAPHR